MPATAGLEFWEIVAVSAICSVVILIVASILGAGVAYVLLREPKAARQPAEARPGVADAASPGRVGHVSPAAG